MKANDIQPGMVIDGWTVVSVRRPMLHALESADIVLFTLERTIDGIHDPKTGITIDVLDYETRRTWYRADEEVDGVIR
jgi:hypothetical protein